MRGVRGGVSEGCQRGVRGVGEGVRGGRGGV